MKKDELKKELLDFATFILLEYDIKISAIKGGENNPYADIFGADDIIDEFLNKEPHTEVIDVDVPLGVNCCDLDLDDNFLSAFYENTNRSLSLSGVHTFSCKKGLWSVSSGGVRLKVECEALHYFQQYYRDGEYDEN